jgi:DNA-binding transcriptional ArsR family regulator
MPQPDPEAVAEAVFAALAEPTRRSILSALAARGPTTATGLAGLLPISRQAITKHLELLAAAGLVLAEPGERRRIRYRVNAAPMAIAQSYLAALARDWDGKLARLQRSLDASAPQSEAAPDPAVPGDDRRGRDGPSAAEPVRG